MNPAFPRIAPFLAACVLLAVGCATTAEPRPSPLEKTVYQLSKSDSAPGGSSALPAVPDPLEGSIYDIAKLDRVPVPTRQVRPRYPVDLRRAGVAGEALVDFIVDLQGTVRNAHAVRATHPAFGEAAVESVMQWRFRPGEKNGRAVNTHMQVPLVFTINER